MADILPVAPSPVSCDDSKCASPLSCVDPECASPLSCVDPKFVSPLSCVDLKCASPLSCADPNCASPLSCVDLKCTSPLSCVDPKYASPLRSTLMVSYHKGRRSLKAFVSILKMIRSPGPFCIDSQSGGDLFVGNDWWWFAFSFIPLVSMWVSFFILVDDPDPFTFCIVVFGGGLVRTVALYSVCYWHREMSPFRLIGAKAKFMIEVIPMIVAAALPHLLEFNYGYLALLICCTGNFYTFAHFMHAAYDIGGMDVLMGSAMLVLVHMLNEELLVGALALSFCLGLSFFRYMTYSPPELPNHCKKELEQLPC